MGTAPLPDAGCLRADPPAAGGPLLLVAAVALVDVDGRVLVDRMLDGIYLEAVMPRADGDEGSGW